MNETGHKQELLNCIVLKYALWLQAVTAIMWIQTFRLLGQPSVYWGRSVSLRNACSHNHDVTITQAQFSQFPTLLIKGLQTTFTSVNKFQKKCRCAYGPLFSYRLTCTIVHFHLCLLSICYYFFKYCTQFQTLNQSFCPYVFSYLLS